MKANPCVACKGGLFDFGLSCDGQAKNQRANADYFFHGFFPPGQDAKQ
jgi:hypothetical protein